VKRVLLTGMSGTGKSSLIVELAARGYKAVDVDSDEWSEWVAVEFDREPAFKIFGKAQKCPKLLVAETDPATPIA
jgi:adenylate kinase family enzyme